jgi:hypothetical protein
MAMYQLGRLYYSTKTEEASIDMTDYFKSLDKATQLDCLIDIDTDLAKIIKRIHAEVYPEQHLWADKKRD